MTVPELLGPDWQLAPESGASAYVHFWYAGDRPALKRCNVMTAKKRPDIFYVDRDTVAHLFADRGLSAEELQAFVAAALLTGTMKHESNDHTF